MGYFQAFLLCVTLAISLSNTVWACCENGDSCNCEPNCWERCFNNPSSTLKGDKDAYIRIYNMALGLRNLYAPCFKPHGTAYMLDATVPGSSTFQYQRDLASIVAQVQPVGDNCNPFCVNKFYNNFAYYVWSWQCKDRCEIFSLFNSRSFASHQSPNSGNSWVGGGLILADHCFKNKRLPCTNCTSNELVIAFTNSQIRGSSSSWCSGPSTGKGRPFYCAAVGTGTATYPNLSSQMQSGSIFLVPETAATRSAASRINRCIHNQCCTQQRWTPYTWPIKNRDAQSPAADRLRLAKDTFGYVSDSSNFSGSNGVKEFNGSFDDFDKQVLKRQPGLEESSDSVKAPVRG